MQAAQAVRLCRPPRLVRAGSYRRGAHAQAQVDTPLLQPASA